MEWAAMIRGGAKTMDKYTIPGNKPYQFGFVLEYVEKKCSDCWGLKSNN